jgi:demethylmenaquinone methyltransferase / 2-methoxy-6-polyprenyl-1,4-benzoquinol methylase
MKPATAYNPRDVDVKQMFNDIAPKYDFLNHFLSAGTDRRWRKKTIRMMKPYQPKQILDIATGTGDLAIEALSLNPDHITGTDISEGMLKIAEKKIHQKNASGKFSVQQAAAEELPFPESTFDAAMVAFGVRNFRDLEKGLAEIFRVLKKDGVVAILEFSTPSSFPLKQLYLLYFRKILPFIGRLVSKNNMAYTYLPDTVLSFPQGKRFTDLLLKTGFSDPLNKRLSFGICSLYFAVKKQE